MTDLDEVLADCDARGIRLRASRGGLTIDAPEDALTPELVGRLGFHKPRLLAMLQGSTPKAESPDAAVVWHLALDRLECDRVFPPEAMEALRAARVHWDTREDLRPSVDEAATETPEATSWPEDSIEANTLDPCPQRGTLDLWQSATGNWRCPRCDPPTAAIEWLKRAALIRKNLAQYWTISPVGDKVLGWPSKERTD